MPETALVSLRTVAFVFPLVTNALSSFDVNRALSIRLLATAGVKFRKCMF